MQFELRVDEARFGYAVDSVVDFSYTLFSDQLNAYGCEPAAMKQLLDLELGDAVSCGEWSLVPHAHTTHLETKAHISSQSSSISKSNINIKCLTDIYILRSVAFLSTDETYEGRQSTSDKVVTAAAFQKQWLEAAWQHEVKAAIIIVDPPLVDLDTTKIDVSRSNPPYFTKEAIQWLRLRYEVLLTNLPSIDREEDGGTTPNHQMFFQNEDNLIVEFLKPAHIEKAEAYLLELQHISVDSDAVPVRPLLYPLARI